MSPFFFFVQNPWSRSKSEFGLGRTLEKKNWEKIDEIILKLQILDIEKKTFFKI